MTERNSKSNTCKCMNWRSNIHFISECSMYMFCSTKCKPSPLNYPEFESKVINIRNANPGNISSFIPCSMWQTSIITILTSCP